MNKVKELRKLSGMNQTDLAQKLGIVQSTLSYWEQGKYDIDNDSLRKLAHIFNVSTDYILGISENVSIDYLLTGEESAQKKPPAEAEGEISVENRVEELLSGLLDSRSGTLMLDGEAATPEAAEYFRNSLEATFEHAKKLNKEKK